MRGGDFLDAVLGDFLDSATANEGPWLLFLLGKEGLVFALAPPAVTWLALFLLPLLKLLSPAFVGEIGDVVPEGDVGDFLEVEGESEIGPAFFKVRRDLAEGA